MISMGLNNLWTADVDSRALVSFLAPIVVISAEKLPLATSFGGYRVGLLVVSGNKDPKLGY